MLPVVHGIRGAIRRQAHRARQRTVGRDESLRDTTRHDASAPVRLGPRREQHAVFVPEHGVVGRLGACHAQQFRRAGRVARRHALPRFRKHQRARCNGGRIMHCGGLRRLRSQWTLPQCNGEQGDRDADFDLAQV